MKPNAVTPISIELLQLMEERIITFLKQKDIWTSLDVDYYPPRVERLFTHHNGFRIYLHVIHQTNEKCLYHKHRWPAAFKQLKGSYEMGITYSPDEIKSDEAHKLPTLAMFTISEGSYYEMTQTDCLHYVKPLTDISLSIMITHDLYPEAEFRKETVDRKLNPLSDARKSEILEMFKILL